MSEDLHKKLLTTPHFTSINPETKLLETRHAATGDLLAVQSSLDDGILEAKASRAVKVMVDGKPVLLEAGVSADRVQSGPRSRWIYSQVVADSIAQLISEGWTLTKICSTPGFPPSYVLAKWRRDHEDFNEAVKQAFQNRGEYHRDKAAEVLEKSETDLTDPDDTPIYKYQTESHLKLASLDNRDRFGNKTTVEGEIAVGHFILDTGIRRAEDPGYMKDQSKIAQAERQIQNGSSEAREVTPVGEHSSLCPTQIPDASDGGDRDGA